MTKVETRIDTVTASAAVHATISLRRCSLVCRGEQRADSELNGISFALCRGCKNARSELLPHRGGAIGDRQDVHNLIEDGPHQFDVFGLEGRPGCDFHRRLSLRERGWHTLLSTPALHLRHPGLPSRRFELEIPCPRSRPFRKMKALLYAAIEANRLSRVFTSPSSTKTASATQSGANAASTSVNGAEA